MNKKCNICGFTEEEYSEKGIPQLLHRLQIPENTDFFSVLAGIKYSIDTDKVSPALRNETKFTFMRMLLTREEDLASEAANSIKEDIGYWAPEIMFERLYDVILGTIQKAKQ